MTGRMLRALVGMLGIFGVLPTPVWGQAANESVRTRFRILVPAEAVVLVEGERTLSTGGERIFESPLLVAGQRYQYDFQARLDGKTFRRKVRFEPGGTIDVDFRDSFREADGQQDTPAPTRPFKPIRPEWLPKRVWRACLDHDPSRTASATAAVSTRRMRGPRSTTCQPASRA